MASPSASQVLHRSLKDAPATVISAHGNHITLSTGRRLFDACGGAAVAVIGHGNTEVRDAVLAQMDKVSYAHTQAFTTPAAESLAAELLVDRPGGLETLYICGSGSEATDSALKLARQYFVERGEHSRTHFIGRAQSYHGNTMAALAAGLNVPRRAPYEPLLPAGFSHVAPANAYRGPRVGEDEAAYVARLAEELDGEFRRVGPERVVAFVAETVGGATLGCVPAPAGYFTAVREVCDRYGALLILDEVMCGMGRTGSLFAFLQEGEAVRPDIITIGKGLAGGYAPVAGVCVGSHVVATLREGSGIHAHGHTYQAHPLSCAAALAVQRIIQREGLIGNCARLGSVLESSLRRFLGDKKYVGDIRGRGLFWGVEFVKDKETKRCFDPAVTFGARVFKRCYEMGVMVYPGAGTVDGTFGDHLLLAPAFNVTDADLDSVVGTLVKAYEEVEKEVDAEK